MNFQGKPKKYLITILKVTGWIFASIFGLLVIISLAIQIPYIQNKLIQKAVNYLQAKIGTEVSLQHISLSIPKKIVLTGLYLEDQQHDTLLYAGELAINTDLLALANRTIQLNDVELSDFKAAVNRTRKDRAFNFDYIVDAFAGDTTANVDTTQAPWKFSIGNISLENIRVNFNDHVGGNELALQLGTLEIAMEEFDLEKSVIRADEITIQDVKTSFTQNAVALDTATVTDDPTSKSNPFDLGANEITLKNIDAAYTHRGLGQTLALTLGELVVEADNVDLNSQIIDLEKLALRNTSFKYNQLAGYAPSTESDSTAKEQASGGWNIKLQDVDLSNNSFQYNNFDVAPQQGFDPNHFSVSQLTVEGQDFAWHESDLQGIVRNLAFQEKGGFTVESFSTEFSMSDSAIQIKTFQFNSPNTVLALNGQARFSSLATIAETYPDAFVNLSVDNSRIGLKDIYFFAPTAFDSLPVLIPDTATVMLDTDIDGKLADLNIKDLTVKTLGKTALYGRGNIQLHRTGEPSFSIDLEKFFTTNSDIFLIARDSLIPSSIALPDWLNIKGSIRGTATSPTVKAAFTSSLGQVDINAELRNEHQAGKSRYKGLVNVKEFQLGKFLRQENVMGPITLTASANGSGLTMETLDTSVQLEIDSFTYQEYVYKNFLLKGDLKKYLFSGSASLRDKNLDLAFNGALDYTPKIPKYHFTFELKNADFQALHLSERPLKARGTLDVNLATADFKVINGNLGIRKVAIFNGKEMYAVDSLLFASIDQEGQSEISIRSDILEGNFAGTINLYSLPEVVRNHFNNYFSLHDPTGNYKPTEAQNFKFNLIIKNTDLLTEILVPDLDPFVPGEIKGDFDSKSDQLNLSMGIAQIRYAGVGVDSITFKVASDKQALRYRLNLQKIQMDSLGVEAFNVQGKVANDSIRTKLTILDSLQKDKYVLGGVFYSLKEVFQFRFIQNEVMLNYAPWSTPRDNSLQFTSQGIQANNFSITHNDESIALQTSQDQDSTVSILFKNLKLQDITKIVEGVTPIEGITNGNVTMMVSDKGAFNSKLNIDNLKILGSDWGDLSLALGKTASGPLNADLRLEGKNTSLKAAGYYNSPPESPEVNFVASIERFDLASIEPLTMGQLKNISGQLTGEVKVTGDPSTPDIDGKLNFVKTSFTPSLINSEFILENETIAIDGDEIILKNFRIKDKQNNLAKIDGKIITRSFQSFDLNLGLSANNFQVLNSTEKDNELFYGNVRITTRTKITGDLNQPVINMNISLSDDSNFTYVVPQSEKGVLEQKGIVEFVDRDAKNDPFLASINTRDTTKATFKGINLSANIELTEKETFNIIIDPVTGDKLSVNGNSTLTLDIDPTGDMILSGRYEITKGSYDLSFYKIVKRKFLIEKGSTIIWSGNPLDATMNIRAIYEIETSPIELIASVQSDPQELNTYKQRLPFLVYLQIKGELLTPEISFQLDMAEAKRNAFGGIVYAKIRDINTRESELNKQVFALLVLKRFISDNPLENKAGSDVASTARRSVSRLLSEQLNRLSENIKGVELSFDVKSYEDYSTGSAEGQTQVQLGLSKSLLDDRLIVKVSGNFEVEGETSNQNSVSDYIGDLALEYKLTEDGRFRITGFRNSNFDMINGELIETGVGLIYIKDYNTLRELFKANGKEN